MATISTDYKGCHAQDVVISLVNFVVTFKADDGNYTDGH